MDRENQCFVGAGCTYSNAQRKKIPTRNLFCAKKRERERKRARRMHLVCAQNTEFTTHSPNTTPSKVRLAKAACTGQNLLVTRRMKAK